MHRVNITDTDALRALAQHYRFDAVCHLAAQAGVRYSGEAPQVYVESNVLGTQSVLEVMRQVSIPHVVYASTSSVYGIDTPAPFSEQAAADRPVSVYAATKRAGELLMHSYHNQYGITATNLSFFTVYGSWSRPDMELWSFIRAILVGEPIELYNEGNLERDFTYIDDIVDGFIAALEKPLQCTTLNLGNGNPITLNTYIATLEAALQVPAKKLLRPMQRGDVYTTCADISQAAALLSYAPKVSLQQGIESFAHWYRAYHAL